MKDWIVFHASLPGSSPENDWWIGRKARVVNLTGRSTMHERVIAENEINKNPKEKEPEKIVTASAKGIDQDDAKTANAGEG